MNKNSTSLLSVIIPCLNESGTVERLIEQLLAQANLQIEIIAVDNSSEDDTLKVLNKYTESGVKVVSGIARGVSKARNAGARVASGKWLLFLDADTLLTENFIPKLTMLLSDNPKFKLAAVAYRASGNNILFKALTYVAQVYQRVMFHVRKEPLIPGAVVLVMRSVHETIGGFNEDIRYNEDFEYSSRAYSAAKSFKSLHSPSTFFSVRRLENGGWRAVFKTYIKAEFARMKGEKYDPEEYDMANHRMK